MGNTNFSSFHESMALKPCSGINIYLISKLWLFGIHFYYKPQCLILCLILKKIFTRKFKMSSFLHNVQQNVHSSSKIGKIPCNFLSLGLFSECFISTPKPFIPSKPHVSDTKQWDLLG